MHRIQESTGASDVIVGLPHASMVMPAAEVEVAAMMSSVMRAVIVTVGMVVRARVRIDVQRGCQVGTVRLEARRGGRSGAGWSASPALARGDPVDDECECGPADEIRDHSALPSA